MTMELNHGNDPLTAVAIPIPPKTPNHSCSSPNSVEPRPAAAGQLHHSWSQLKLLAKIDEALYNRQLCLSLSHFVKTSKSEALPFSFGARLSCVLLRSFEPSNGI
ncbi:hypothetical protein V6N13_067030 [Hibiscus sabdariffa]|uniref:Uncharacterized protein n=1 Tax=Hibiscus sabdariffa TaxID=183260 RepID=A0ABR2DS88_9ROSI